MPMQKSTKEKTESSIEALKELITGETTLYYTTEYSKSGGTRWTRIFIAVLNSDGKPAIRNITWHVAHACGYGAYERDGHWVIKGSGWGYNELSYYAPHLARNLGLKDTPHYESL